MSCEIINIALQHYGIKEVPGGAGHNPAIVNFFHAIGHEWVQDDETAWCAAFANYVLQQAGYDLTGELNARSFLKLEGEPMDEPQIGDLAIFWRESPNSWKGHVGFYVRSEGHNIYVLGGNQNNEVNIKPYPRARLLGYVRPKKCATNE